MLISEKLNAAINEEIGREFQASHQYVAIACHFQDRSMSKLAGLFFKQSDEERDHGMKFVHYVNEVGGKVVLPVIPAPIATFATGEEAIQAALKWELDVTAHINNLMALAIEEKDYIAQDFLRWFVTEQREEVAKMDGLLKVVQQVGERNLIMVEGYLSHG